MLWVALCLCAVPPSAHASTTVDAILSQKTPLARASRSRASHAGASGQPSGGRSRKRSGTLYKGVFTWVQGGSLLSTPSGGCRSIVQPP